MVKILDKYSATATIFLTMAVVFVALPLILSFEDYITSTFVIAGLTCTIMGCFVLIFSGNEPVDPQLVSLLPVQGCLNLCRMASDSGFHGNAYFLPARITGETRVMQFNPVSTFHWSMNLVRQVSDLGIVWNASALPPRANGEPRVHPGAPHGLMTVPVSDPLITVLKKRNALIIVDGEEEMSALISEIVSDVFDFGHKVTVTREAGMVTITLHRYRFIEECLYTRSESPECCTRYPCPLCSLCGTLVTECLDHVIALEKCSVISDQDITMVFSFSEQ